MDDPGHFVEGEALEDLWGKRNPLELSPVIASVYRFLSLEDIKKCRFVSLEWSSTATLFLGARKKILLSNKEKKKAKSLSKLMGFYSENLNIRFNAFKIEYGDWSLKELNEFFEIHQFRIQELELDQDIGLVDEDGKIIKSFDITPWISQSRITKPNTKYSTKLLVYGRPFNRFEPPEPSSTYIIVPLDILAPTKCLLLHECQVNISPGEKISPEKLHFTANRFYQDGELLEEIRINDIVDFSKSKDVNLMCAVEDNTRLILDLGENTETVRLDILSVHNITLLNSSLSEWIVDNFYSYNISLLEKMEMQIRKLTTERATIDLFALPQSIESLCINDIGHIYTRVVCSQPISLQNLTHLNLKFYFVHTDVSVISHFRNCSKLELIHCRSDCEILLTWKFEWIPKSVKIIKLEFCILDLVTEDKNDSLNLDKLILEYHSCDKAKQVFQNKIFVKDLVLNCPTPISSVDEQNNFLDFLKSSRSSISQRIYVGPFKWYQGKRKEKYTINPMESFVDKLGEYYVFENMEGKEITESEFLMKLKVPI